MTAQDAPAEPRVDSATSAPLEPAQASVERVSIDSLHIDPGNTRLHDERNKSTIRASLARFGAGRSIVLDRNNVVRAGNGTLEQARQAGFDEVLVVEPRPNQIVAVKRPDWSDTEATAYSVQDNRSTDLSRNDDAALAATLEAVRNEDASLLEATGYTGDEVDALLERLAGELVDNPQAEWQGMPEFVNKEKKPFQSIIIHFHSEKALAEFAVLVNQKITPATKFINFPWQPNEHFGVAETQTP